MWKQTTKLPAWLSLTDARLPRLTPATESEAEALQEVLGERLLIERLELGGRHLQMYRVKGDSRIGECLIKWLPSDRYDEAWDAYNLSLWLSEQGFLTPYPVYKPCQLSSSRGGFIYGFNYFHHRLLKPTPSDMQALAISLVQLHDVLPHHEEYGVWEQNTEKRLALLASVRDSLVNGTWRPGPDPDRLSEIASDNSLDFIRSDLPRQSLHGDLNYRNAFVPIMGASQSTSKVMLLDFEDVTHSVLPVVFELALVIERFIMVRDIDNEIAIASGQAFLASYKDKYLHKLDIDAVDWVNVIQSLNLRSLCVLSLIESQGGDIPDEEWHKFFYLFGCAKQQAALWCHIAS